MGSGSRRITATQVSGAEPNDEPKPEPTLKRKRPTPPQPQPQSQPLSTSELDLDPLPKLKELLFSPSSPLDTHNTSRSSPLSFDLRTVSQLSPTELQICMDIVHTTSGTAYRASSIGWKPRLKLEEMSESGMLYLLVKRADVTSTNEGAAEVAEKDDTAQKDTAQDSWPSQEIYGLVSFLPTHDDPPYAARRVLYIYELHLHPSLRGLGLGSALIRFVEASARALGIDKTMLTVFTSNAAARAVYGRLGYARDVSSPVPRRVGRGKAARVVESEYEILSKEVGGVEAGTGEGGEVVST